MNRLYTFAKKASNYISSLSKEKKLFFLSLTFLCLTYFVPNNKFFLIEVLLFVTGLFLIWRNLLLALLSCYILLIPFSVGKGIEFLLIPAEYINPLRIREMAVPYTIFFTFTMLNLLQAALFYLYFRNEIISKGIKPSHRRDFADNLLVLFIITNIVSGIASNIPLLSLLLTIQIIGYLFVYHLVRYYGLKTWLQKTFPIFASSFCAFEGFWTVLQLASRGPLKKYIENIPDLNTSGFLVHTANESSTYLRMQGTFNHPNDLGIAMATMLPIVFYYSVSKYSSSFGKTAAAFGSMGGFVALVASGSRASWIVFILAIIFLFSIKTIRLSWDITPLIKKSYRIFIYLFLAIFPFVIVPRLTQLSKTFSYDGGASFRTDLITKSIFVALQHPLGIGLGVFPQVLFIDIGGFTSHPTQPHNLILQILVASGFIGMFSFLGFIYLKIRKAYLFLGTKIAYASQVRIVGFISLSAYLFLSMLYPILTEQPVFGLLWILLLVIEPEKK
ncbi:O-antigen ligase family protein [Patescibacteria group bacterium]